MEASRRRMLGVRVPEGIPFRPPWSLPEADFLARCTRCDACVTACPAELLQRGDGGFPVADFSASSCSFCGECAAVCSPGAILRSPEAAPWSERAVIGEACLAAQNVECRVCGERCDHGAIRFRPRLGGVPLPEVNDSCTGCGACLAPCPVSAIRRASVPTALPGGARLPGPSLSFEVSA